MTVDYRTRCDADVTDIDITEFFSHTFANLLDNATPYIQPWLAGNTPEDLSIECEGVCWHLSAADGRIQSTQGMGETGLLVKLTASEFSGLVNDLYTPMTFFPAAT
jgi:hypothetical protein